jgi:hypothetical protein
MPADSPPASAVVAVVEPTLPDCVRAPAASPQRKAGLAAECSSRSRAGSPPRAAVPRRDSQYLRAPPKRLVVLEVQRHAPLQARARFPVDSQRPQCVIRTVPSRRHAAEPPSPLPVHYDSRT